MENSTLQELKEKLKKEERLLEEELGSFARKPTADTNYETTFPNFGSHAQEQDENAEEVEKYIGSLSIEHRLESQLRDIRYALEKMTRTTYGVCEVCKKEIALERLQASPAAKTCVTCKA